MISIPTIIAALVVYCQEAPNWIFWGVIGFGIFAWLCGKAFINAKNDLAEGQETDERVLKFWSSTANIIIWLQWIICIVVIVISFAFSWSSASSELFKNAISKAIDINEISANLPNIQEPNSEKAKNEEKKMITLTQQCKELSDEIDDQFLHYLHADLTNAFKNKLIVGQQLYADGFSEGNPSKQISAIKLLVEWEDYWEENGKTIIKKLENR